VLAHRLRTRVPRPRLGATAVLVVLLLGAQSLYIWGRSFEDGYGVHGVCAARVSALSTPDDLVVVGTDSASVDGAVPNNYEQPIVHYRADRRGWVLAADWYDRTDLVAGYRDDGARFFVDPFPNQMTGSLRAWLDGNGVRVTSAAAEGCDIWRLGSG
jgi:hypothetical protein